jgi:alkylhydroperoxidase/carboxymuconolactone decarboxylase family protein YurZ
MNPMSPFVDEGEPAEVFQTAAFEYEAGPVAWSLDTESAGVRAGHLHVDRVPVLASHRGESPALVLRWNDMPSVPAEIDVVVHLHGYSRLGMTLPTHIEKWSGLDLTPLDRAGGGGRSRPTLTVLPRGDSTGVKQRHGNLYVYTFPALVQRDALMHLVSFALQSFARHARGTPPRVSRLILTAHSGGGSPLMKILRFLDPHEVHVFDGLYGDATPLAEWAARHVRQDAAGTGAPGACRVFYRGGTRRFSRQVQQAIDAALGSGSGPLRDRYRTEASTLNHWQIPRQYGWRMLADPGSHVPDARRDPAARHELQEELVGPGFEELEDAPLYEDFEHDFDHEQGAFEEEAEAVSTMSPFLENGTGMRAFAEPAWSEAPFDALADEESLDLPWEPELEESAYAEEAGYGEEEAESGEVERAEADEFLGEVFAGEGELYETTAADVATYPNGATLRIVARSAPPGTEHWDPNNAGVPLVDTSNPSLRLSANFIVGELARSGGKTFNPARIDPKLVACLQKLRERVGTSVIVKSAYRPYLYNIDVYNARGQKPTLSQHSSGRAADIKVAGMNGMQIAKAAIDACGGNIGVGIGSDYAHVDVRGTFAKWTYFKDKAADARAVAEITDYQRHRAGGAGATATSTSATAPVTPVGAADAPSVDDFVATALTQRGDPYVFGAEAHLGGADVSHNKDDPRERGQERYCEYFGRRKDMEGADALDEMTVDHLFANVWSRPRLDLRNRSMITVALLAAQGRDEELERHLEGARRQNLDRQEIEEIMVHVAHYAGWSAGHHGLDVARRVGMSPGCPRGGRR